MEDLYKILQLGDSDHECARSTEEEEGDFWDDLGLLGNQSDDEWIEYCDKYCEVYDNNDEREHCFMYDDIEEWDNYYNTFDWKYSYKQKYRTDLKKPKDCKHHIGSRHWNKYTYTQDELDYCEEYNDIKYCINYSESENYDNEDDTELWDDNDDKDDTGFLDEFEDTENWENSNDNENLDNYENTEVWTEKVDYDDFEDSHNNDDCNGDSHDSDLYKDDSNVNNMYYLGHCNDCDYYLYGDWTDYFYKKDHNYYDFFDDYDDDNSNENMIELYELYYADYVDPDDDSNSSDPCEYMNDFYDWEDM